jgi:hypothetical protein
MNLQKLLDACGGPGKDFDYLKEIAVRLEKVLGSWLTLPECIALMNILAYYSFKYDDGFMISDERDPNKIVGLSDAAAIVACFCREPDRDWYQFKVEYPAYNKENKEYEILFNEMLSRILQDPAIRLREIGEPKPQNKDGRVV